MSHLSDSFRVLRLLLRLVFLCGRPLRPRVVGASILHPSSVRACLSLSLCLRVCVSFIFFGFGLWRMKRNYDIMLSLFYNFQYMKESRDITRVSVERVASGTGLANVYEFLSGKFPDRLDQAVHEGEKDFLI